jgi:hypothetical protein
VGHVVAVAHPGDDLALPAAERLPDGHEIGEDLARVLEIGQPVDHRD